MRYLYSVNIEVWIEDGVYFPSDIVEVVEADDNDPYKDDQSMLARFITKQVNGLAGADVTALEITQIATANTEVNE